MNEPMIPGGFEKRPARGNPPPPIVREPLTPAGSVPQEADRGRLEREREGGGAPSQRKVKRP